MILIAEINIYISLELYYHKRQIILGLGNRNCKQNVEFLIFVSNFCVQYLDKGISKTCLQNYLSKLNIPEEIFYKI